MKTPVRLMNMVLRGHADKFKAVLQEELEERVSVLLQELYKSESQKVLDLVQNAVSSVPVAESVTVNATEKALKFFPESTYQLKDGNIGILTESERHLVAKLHENLNNDNKERLVKLLSESQESFNRVLKLAKTENKK